MDEVTNEVITNNEALISIIDYVNKLAEVVDLNTQTIELTYQLTEKLQLFIQAIAKLSFKAVDIGKNNYDRMSGYFARISDRTDIVELIQDSHSELIQTLEKLTYYSLSIGILNTTFILIIGIYLIMRKN